MAYTMTFVTRHGGEAYTRVFASDELVKGIYSFDGGWYFNDEQAGRQVTLATDDNTCVVTWDTDEEREQVVALQEQAKAHEGGLDATVGDPNVDESDL